jgi:hypothetical protein
MPRPPRSLGKIVRVQFTLHLLPEMAFVSRPEEASANLVQVQEDFLRGFNHSEEVDRLQGEDRFDETCTSCLR